MGTSEYIEVRTTIDSKEGAVKIATALVESRIAACVQISGPITSTYWWEGTVESAEEWVCTVKTQASLYSNVEQGIRDVHTYDVPEIIAVPIIEGSQSYLKWIKTETTH